MDIFFLRTRFVRRKSLILINWCLQLIYLTAIVHWTLLWFQALCMREWRCTGWCCHANLAHALRYGYLNFAVLRPPGTAGRGAKALWECGAPTRRAVVCRVQTRPELAEENRRNLSRGSQKDQEHILRLWKFGLKTPGGLLAITTFNRKQLWTCSTIVLYQVL